MYASFLKCPICLSFQNPFNDKKCYIPRDES